MVGLADLDGWASALILPLHSAHVPLEAGYSQKVYLPQTQEGQRPVKGKQVADLPCWNCEKVLKEGRAQILSELH